MRKILSTVLLMAACVRGAHAQEYEASRRTYVFFGRDLAIEVIADSPGALQVVRGERGQVEVAAHAEDGLAAFGLGGYHGDQLRLTALGAQAADYIVVVPEDVRVSVLLPGQRFANRIPDGPAPVLRWDAVDPAAQLALRSPVIQPDADGLFLVHRAEIAPPALALVEARVRRLEVRTGARDFRVAASEPLAFQPGQGPLVVRTGERAIDLVIDIPAGTRFFELRDDGEAMLSVTEGKASSPCRGVRVRVSGEGEVYRFVGGCR